MGAVKQPVVPENRDRQDPNAHKSTRNIFPWKYFLDLLIDSLQPRRQGNSVPLFFFFFLLIDSEPGRLKEKEKSLLKQDEVLGNNFSIDNYESKRYYAISRDGNKIPILSSEKKVRILSIVFFVAV